MNRVVSCHILKSLSGYSAITILDNLTEDYKPIYTKSNELDRVAKLVLGNIWIGSTISLPTQVYFPTIFPIAVFVKKYWSTSLYPC